MKLAPLSLLGLVLLSSSAARASVPSSDLLARSCRQEISISFDLAKGIMQGKSTVFVPPDAALRLSLDGMEQIQAMLEEDGSRKPLSPNGKGIALPRSARQRTLSVSWQLRSSPAAGILIAANGIALAGSWHPTTDRDMLFALEAALPHGFAAISEAEEIGSDQEAYRAASRRPLPSLSFAAGPYQIQTRQAGGIALSAYFFSEDRELADEYLDSAAAHLRRYEQLLGPFPFARYAIVENRLPTGYGMAGFTLLGQSVIRLPFIKDASLSHEILHSWFGNGIRDDENGTWSEGLTAYLADQLLAEERGEGSAHRKNQLLRHQAWAADEKNIVTAIDFRHGSHDQPQAEKMRAIGYDKVSMIFHALRGEIGDRAFFAALRRLCSERMHGKAGWTNLEEAFSAEAGQDMSLFLGQWLLRRDVPSIAAENVRVERKDGKSMLFFRLVQEGTDPYRLRVPLAVRSRQGVQQRVVRLEKSAQDFYVETDSQPLELIVDPEHDLMRRLRPSERPPTWAQLLGSAQKTVVLPDDKELAAYRPLLAALERRGTRQVKATELKNSQLSQGSFVFLGSSVRSRELFADPERPSAGFVVDVRRNPLALGQVMALIFSSSAEEAAAAVRKLDHYGVHSHLCFLGGALQDKRMASAEQGIRTILRPPPAALPARTALNFEAVVAEILHKRVVYVGETHDDYGAHLLQLQVVQALREEQEKSGDSEGLSIGLEMFPRSSQQALDDWTSGRTNSEREFAERSGYFDAWGFDYRLYRDIFSYARRHGIPLVGLNLDKKIASSVFRQGSTDGLSAAQLAQAAAERDLDLLGYRDRLEAVHALHSGGRGAGFGGFLQAQGLWDETMAESVVSYLQAHPKKKMVVLAGVGHVRKDGGIPPRVGRRLKVSQTVLMPIDSLEGGREADRQADYLLLTEQEELPPAGKLGVVLEEAEEAVGRRVAIVRISPEGKADEAGLREKDVVLAVDGMPVSSIGGLKAALLDKKPGDLTMLWIGREKERLEVKVELSDMDGAALTMPPSHPKQ